MRDILYLLLFRGSMCYGKWLAFKMKAADKNERYLSGINLKGRLGFGSSIAFLSCQQGNLSKKTDYRLFVVVVFIKTFKTFPKAFNGDCGAKNMITN